MHKYQFLIFFGTVIAIYSLINYYIYRHAMMAIPAGTGFAKWFPWLFLFAASAYLVGRVLERVWLSPVSDFFTWAGSFWLALMTYFFLAVVLIDLIRLVHYFIPVYPPFMTNDWIRTKFTLLILVSAAVGFTVLAGFVNSRIPAVRQLEVKVKKKVPGMQSLDIVMASDIHLGTIMGPVRTRQLVRMINAQDPDIILFAGDIVDEDLAPVIRHDLGRDLLKLKSKYGIYAITGNHEYIGGAKAAVQYLEAHGIQMLRDTCVLIGNAFYVAGRTDRDAGRFSGQERMPLDKVLDGINRELPVILMDHQPFHLDQVAAAGVDLQLSGHTHHGQLWPFNYITKAMYENSFGYLKKDDTHFYVSCGFGGWGPPVRTVSRPEIVRIMVVFD